MLKYTTEDLIQYLYNETSEDRTRAIEKAITESWDLQEKLDALRESMTQLDTIKTGPRPQTIAAILNYAKSTSEVLHP